MMAQKFSLSREGDKPIVSFEPFIQLRKTNHSAKQTAPFDADVTSLAYLAKTP